MTRTEQLSSEKQHGLVYLVGAGPGDPGLITVRARQLLDHADVLIFDALANPTLIASVPETCEKIDAGKRANKHTLTQDQINEVLINRAKQGKTVVRLKGGDPFLFGRAAEEAAALSRVGIDCEIVCGITSGIAAPAAAGIPVTHRHIASTLTFVTGHEDPTKPESSVDYRTLADLAKRGGTLCFYMGVARLPAIVDSLQSHGLPASTPVALVQWGTTPRQRSVRTTLAHAVADVQQAGISSPAIIVVGQVAGIDEPGLDHFTRRPLFGQRILITRTRQQASALRDQLATLGADVLEAPTIELVPPTDWADVDHAITHIADYDWLILTSTNGVNALADRMAMLERDARHLAAVKIAAIGDATEQALRERLSIHADLIPTRYVAESLAAALIARENITQKKILLLRADIARPALPKLLTEAGAIITEHVIYQTKRTDALPDEVLTALRDGSIDWVTFTSSSTAQNMIELLGNESHLLSQTKIASIGPITTQTLEKQGSPPTIEASQSNIPGLVQALCDAVSKQS